MVRINVNDDFDFLIEKISDQFLVNGENKEFDIRKIDRTIYHIIHNNKSYNVDILHFDIASKTVEIKVNGHNYKVSIQDEHDLLLEKMGIKKDAPQRIDDVVAPMPGLIVDIHVAEGQKVKTGDPMVVLKAMKMENVLKSPHDGRIKQIMVEINQKVEKDAVILQF